MPVFRDHPNAIAFEKELVTVTPERLEIHHHCPLVSGWQKVGVMKKPYQNTQKLRCGDHGMFTNVKDAKFTLASTIADGILAVLILDKEK